MIRLLFVGILTVGTLGAWMGSARGWGLPRLMKEPVSIRQESVQGSGHRGPRFIYFGGMGRSHHGGGFRGGK